MAKNRHLVPARGMSEAILSGLAANARHGESVDSTQAARELILEFCRDATVHFRNGDPFRLEPFQFVVESLFGVLQGEDIAKAFGLKRKQRGRPKKNKERDVLIALSVHARMQDGMTLEVAAEEVAPLYGFHGENGFTKIKDIYSENKAVVPLKLSWHDDLEKIGIPRPYK